ncbi:hypothetical protein CSOJ01_11124 [Colletotrichum sojae]|uniref:Uncharacterized protein n=1 Tax=Colletotrichum sojae TaxID=2175907 RepID=A0A8H6IZ78_9PEZI|nr:hypothetical protein CSOJ01_11124 [Colletotrichum sojae]
MDSIRGGWWKGKICVEILRVDMQRSTSERRKATLRRQQLARNMGEGGRPAPPLRLPRVEYWVDAGTDALGRWMDSSGQEDDDVEERESWCSKFESPRRLGKDQWKSHLRIFASSHLRTFALSHFPSASQTSAPSLKTRGWQSYSCNYKSQSEATLYLMPEGRPFLAFFSVFLLSASLSIASPSRPPISMLIEPTHLPYLLQLPEMQFPVPDYDIGFDESTHHPPGAKHTDRVSIERSTPACKELHRRSMDWEPRYELGLPGRPKHGEGSASRDITNRETIRLEGWS